MVDIDSSTSTAELVRNFLKDNPDKTNQEIVDHFKELGRDVKSSYVRNIKSRSGLSSKSNTPNSPKKFKPKKRSSHSPKYPRHNLEKALRIPKAIFDQNAGRSCTEQESATFVGVKYNKGPYTSEISSCIKYGLLIRPKPSHLELTEISRQILRPQNQQDILNGLRKAVKNSPEISDVYEHYRGENLPDEKFFKNALIDKFNIPESSLSDFISIFTDTLEYAKLIEEKGGKIRLLDVTASSNGFNDDKDNRIKTIGKGVKVNVNDTCFVMMPFAEPLGGYYSLIYKPAIEKAGLTPIRADDDIFSTGKIIDQIWKGITTSKVLVAELTSRNANVFYELGLAHALQKPVVLVSSNEEDVPFDLNHIRVIYYDVKDPFWGQKLIDKIAENIISAIKNPEEALFKTALRHS